MQLPRPGMYSAEFSVTMANRGPAAARTIVSKEKLTYQATLGLLDRIRLAGFPTAPQRLGSTISTMYLECLDEFGNCWHSTRVPKLEFAAGQLIFSNEPPRWERIDAGKHVLCLPAVVIKPGSLRQHDFSSPNKPLSVKGTVGMSSTLNADFTLRVLPGKIVPVPVVVESLLGYACTRQTRAEMLMTSVGLLLFCQAIRIGIKHEASMS